MSVDVDWRPSALDAQALATVLQMIPAYERYLAPATNEQVAARVTVLLSHYYTPDHSPAVAKAIIGDWLDIVGRYPAWAINQAAADYLETHERRPTIADIVRLCEFWTSDARAELQMLRRVAAAAPSAPAAVH